MKLRRNSVYAKTLVFKKTMAGADWLCDNGAVVALRDTIDKVRSCMTKSRT